MEDKKAFGDAIIGEWFCSKCGYYIFPRQLRERQDRYTWIKDIKTGYFKPACPECKTPLQYDGAE